MVWWLLLLLYIVLVVVVVDESTTLTPLAPARALAPIANAPIFFTCENVLFMDCMHTFGTRARERERLLIQAIERNNVNTL